MAAKTKSQGELNKPQGELNIDLIKALGHTLRFQALHIFNKRVTSPNEVSRELGVPVNKLAYHVRVLEKSNLIELVKTEQRRGATEHYYRATSRAQLTDEDWMHLPKNIQSNITFDVMKVIGREVGSAMQTGSFDARNDRRQTWLSMQLDEEGWREAIAILAEAEERLISLEAEATERRIANGSDPVPMSVALLGFESPSS